MVTNPIQGSLFEEDYLVRSLGSIANVPDVALTELVANAWDAGASRVEILIPNSYGEQLIVSDDGTGMTPEQFKQRWMTLGYDRVKHQGPLVEYPSDREGAQRRAYGRNGVGRHGMLCFADEYTVESRRDGEGGVFRVAATSGRDPFELVSEEPLRKPGSGTRLICKVKKHLPHAETIRQVLAGRFLYDPMFSVEVDGKTVPLHQHSGLIEKRLLKVTDEFSVTAICVGSMDTARTGQQHGVAFWVGGRLVGEPSWTLGGTLLLDGRTQLAKRLTVVVQVDDAFSDVEVDWSGFRKTELVTRLFEVVGEYVREVTARLLEGKVAETSRSALVENKQRFRELNAVARLEVASFAREVAIAQPTISHEALSTAVQAVIKLEESRSGKLLLDQLSRLSPEDIEGLTRLLQEWTVRDAMTVLDEIGRRIKVVEALEKLAADKSVLEMRTIHPLVTQARWLFGPEFESPHYAWNITVRRAVEKLWGKSVEAEAFVNPKKRPDLIFLPDRTISAVATEEHDPDDSALVHLGHVLLIELKKGGEKIGRAEANQVSGYVEDLLGPGVLDGAPTIHAYVVGYEVDPRIQKRRFGEQGFVEAVSFDRLVRTANKRLFDLRKKVQDRWKDLGNDELVAVLDEQRDFFE